LEPNTGPSRDKEEYLASISGRIRQLIAGRCGEVREALRAGDPAALERIADAVNGICIGGRPVDVGQVEIVAAPTCAAILAGAPSGGDRNRRTVRDEILAGRIAAQFFFAGAATRFGKAAQGLLYAFEAWEMVDRMLDASEGEVPEYARPMDLREFRRIRDAVVEASSRIPRERRLRIPLGPRILLAYRVALDRLARQSGDDPARIRKQASFLIHVPDSEGGLRILDDLLDHRFYGFEPGRILVVVQPLFGGWTITGDDTVVPIPESQEFPYGHGYSTLQLAHPGSASLWRAGRLVDVPEAPLEYLLARDVALIHTHRINDLTQLSPAILDLDRLAAGRLLIDQGHAVIIELVQNPQGQKGGNWVGLKGGDHRFLVEGLNAKVRGWSEFLERSRGAPYNAFRNIYDARALRSVLQEHNLAENLRIRRIDPPPAGGPSLGLYLESVTGDLTQIPEARAAAFRLSDREEIHDLKELKDLPEGIGFIAAQDLDDDFRLASADFLRW